MERIIRLNAVETSNQPSSSRINLSGFYPSQDLAAKMASNYVRTVAAETTVRETPTKINTAAATTLLAAILLTVCFLQPSSAFPYLVLLSSAAFFNNFVVWAWKVNIEEVCYARRKYLQYSQDLGKVVKIAVTVGQQAQARQVVAAEEQTAAITTSEWENTPKALERLLAAREAVVNASTGIHLPYVYGGAALAEIAFLDATLVLLVTLLHRPADFLNKRIPLQIQLNIDGDRESVIIPLQVIFIALGSNYDEKLSLVCRFDVALARNYRKRSQAFNQIKSIRQQPLQKSSTTKLSPP